MPCDVPAHDHRGLRVYRALMAGWRNGSWTRERKRKLPGVHVFCNHRGPHLQVGFSSLDVRDCEIPTSPAGPTRGDDDTDEPMDFKSVR